MVQLGKWNKIAANKNIVYFCEKAKMIGVLALDVLRFCAHKNRSTQKVKTSSATPVFYRKNKRFSYSLSSLFLVLLCLLYGCATKHTNPNLQVGQTAFDSGDYPQAFHLLLPIASDGNAKAQYAVGYIYYNGYGVTPDKESGLFWIQESAKQNYAPAVKALDDILQQVVNETPASAPTTADATSTATPPPTTIADATSAMTPPESAPTPTQVSQSDVVLQSIKSNDKPEKKVIVDNTPVKEEAQKHYALQVFGSYSLDTVKTMQVKLHVQNQSHIFHTKHNDKDWYVLTYGGYNSIADAILAENNLSSSLSQLHPWVRKIDQLSQIG